MVGLMQEAHIRCSHEEGSSMNEIQIIRRAQKEDLFYLSDTCKHTKVLFVNHKTVPHKTPNLLVP
jgi:hypothetical protein